MLGKDKTAVTRLVNALVKSGLVGRVQDKQDRRMVRACITAEGKTAFTRIFPQLMALSQRAFQGLSHEDIDLMQRILKQMVENLSGQQTSCPSRN
jgi:DNA-binding MarR family transcriptional regulator